VEAAYLQIPFPFAGLLGSIAAGFASDLFFDARHAPVAVLMLLAPRSPRPCGSPGSTNREQS